ncbi:hypothetical protein F4779DRAFT_344375 [Xylariaceae sp. FL0662B]|nr:hypothetical protein F4779DRAFT_344375 [Xylariaceae sp. FL0662B]
MIDPHVLQAVLGTFALLATAAVLALDTTIARAFSTSDSLIKIAAIVASAWEAVMLIVLIGLLIRCVERFIEHGSRKYNGVWFGFGLVASVLASAASVVLLISMGKAEDLPNAIFEIPSRSFLIGSAVALGFAFLEQLLFIVVHFVVHRLPNSEQALSLHTNEEGRRSPPVHVKSIPYTRTVASSIRTMNTERMSMDYMSRPGSSSGRSAAETMSSIRTSISHAVHPSGSKTRLLSTSSRTRKRPPSIDSSYRDRSSDGFDSWDTSSVDPHNRQTVLDTSSPVRSRFLETIPASPTMSRSPSPGCPLDLEPPKRCRRSQSYSPIPRAHHERSMTPQSSSSELHIHPLFRSDSPIPPPTATPGTMVVAAPNAGLTISEKSLTRMRSGSLPTAPYPLSRHGSYDSFRKTPSPNTDRFRTGELAEERALTPPIPEWVLGSGSRASLSEYQTRRFRDQ